jgi:hypothetical protein
MPNFGSWYEPIIPNGALSEMIESFRYENEVIENVSVVAELNSSF